MLNKFDLNTWNRTEIYILKITLLASHFIRSSSVLFFIFFNAAWCFGVFKSRWMSVNNWCDTQKLPCVAKRKLMILHFFLCVKTSEPAGRTVWKLMRLKEHSCENKISWCVEHEKNFTADGGQRFENTLTAAHLCSGWSWYDVYFNAYQKENDVFILSSTLINLILFVKGTSKEMFSLSKHDATC